MPEFSQRPAAATVHSRRTRALRTATVMLAGCALLGASACSAQPQSSAAPADADCLTGATSELAATPLPDLGDLTLVDNPKSYVGPSTAVLTDTTITPLDPAVTAQLPVTVTSHTLDGDVDVTVADTCRLLGLSLDGSISATIDALGFGGNLVGRDVSTTFPGSEDLPLVTQDGHSLNTEAVLALNPSLIITDGTIGESTMGLFSDAGVTVVYVDPGKGLEGVKTLSTQVGAALGVADAGEALATRLGQEIQAQIDEIATISPSDPDEKLRMVFLYLRGTSGVYYLLGEGSGADWLIDSLGGIDVAAELGWEDLRPLNDEALIGADPDLFIVMTNGLDSAGGIDGLLEDKPAIALTPAGEHRRFVDMADGDVLSFGPRTAGALNALATAIYAPED